jgi:hypothetical protein
MDLNQRLRHPLGGQGAGTGDSPACRASSAWKRAR